MKEKKFSLESGLAKGREFPKWFVEFPAIVGGEDMFLDAFWTLSTERQIGHGIGPIPWSAAVRFATHHGFERDVIDRIFWPVLHRLDSAYIDYKVKEHKRNNPPKAGKKPTKASGSGIRSYRRARRGARR